MIHLASGRRKGNQFEILVQPVFFLNLKTSKLKRKLSWIAIVVQHKEIFKKRPSYYHKNKNKNLRKTNKKPSNFNLFSSEKNKNQTEKMFLIWFLFAFSPWLRSTVSEFCDISYCNNRGICNEENGVKTCSCEDRYYEGPKCETVKDLCIPITQCTELDICTSMEGEFFCACPAGKYGKRCSLTIESPKDWMVLYPPVVEFGVKIKLLIAAKTMGNKDNIKFFSFSSWKDYIHFNYPTNYKHTTDLNKVIADNDIYKPFDLPYTTGYYFIQEHDFWEIGKLELNFEICGPICEPMRYYISIYRKDPTCITFFTSEIGNNLYNPDFVEVDQITIVRPKRTFACGRINETFKFSYYVTNWANDKTFFHFHDQNEPFLKIPAYSFSAWPDEIGFRVISNIEEVVGDRTLLSKTFVSWKYFQTNSNLKA